MPRGDARRRRCWEAMLTEERHDARTAAMPGTTSSALCGRHGSRQASAIRLEREDRAPADARQFAPGWRRASRATRRASAAARDGDEEHGSSPVVRCSELPDSNTIDRAPTFRLGRPATAAPGRAERCQVGTWMRGVPARNRLPAHPPYRREPTQPQASCPASSPRDDARPDRHATARRAAQPTR